ncbi:MAG: hypothetical protein DRR42_24345 [Gammaproteobacteria bacterium]|nr:MAG: hypothetical protein DRR42_24345 [Gammaproteobacteria bacterium]
MYGNQYYSNLRAPFAPSEVNLVLLFESPPDSGRYFYDPNGKTTEPLFSAVMKLLRWNPVTKAEGLELLRDTGIILLDATYQQVNNMSDVQRREIMRSEYEQLEERLPDAPILIGMVKVLDAVGQRLKDEGYEVLNNRVRVPFPSNGNQKKFHTMASRLLEGEKRHDHIHKP